MKVQDLVVFVHRACAQRYELTELPAWIHPASVLWLVNKVYALLRVFIHFEE